MRERAATPVGLRHLTPPAISRWASCARKPCQGFNQRLIAVDEGVTMHRTKDLLRDHPEYVALLLGALLHAVALFLILPLLDTVGNHYGLGFRDDYDKLALNVMQGNGFRFFPETAATLLREPGYPVVLAVTFSILGYSLLSAQILNYLLMVGTAILLLRLIRAFSGHRLVAAAAMLLLFAHPGGLVAQIRGGFEPLFAFLLTAFTLCLSKALSSQARTHYLAAGIVLGLIVLVRSNLLALPILALAVLMAFPGAGASRGRRAGGVALLALGMLLTITPWAARNYLAVGEIVPTATVSGVAAHVGQYVCRNRNSGRTLQELDTGARDERSALARGTGFRFKDGYYQFFYASRDELEFCKLLMSKSVAFYSQNPSSFLGCTTANLLRFWVTGRDEVATRLNAVVQVPYLLLAIVGFFLALRAPAAHAYVTPAAIAILYSMAVHSITLAQARYNVPLLPLLALFGAIPLTALLRAAGGLWRARFTRRTADSTQP